MLSRQVLLTISNNVWSSTNVRLVIDIETVLEEKLFGRKRVLLSAFCLLPF